MSNLNNARVPAATLATTDASEKAIWTRLFRRDQIARGASRGTAGDRRAEGYWQRQCTPRPVEGRPTQVGQVARVGGNVMAAKLAAVLGQ